MNKQLALWGIWTLAAVALPLQAQTAPPVEPAAGVVAPTPVALDGAVQPLTPVATAGADYRISFNDLMAFEVFGVADMKRDVRVNASGMVTLPLIGPVAVAGLTASAAEQLIAERYAEKYLQNPQVSLFIKEFTTQRITIEGAVLKPGIYPLNGQLTLLRALALSGGYAQYADLSEVMMYRTGADGVRTSFTYDLEKVRAGEVVDPEVRSDDLIVVKRNANRTALRDSLFRDILDTLNPFSR